MQPIIVDPRAMRARNRMFKKYGGFILREGPRFNKSRVEEAAVVAREPRYCIEGICIFTETAIANQRGEIIVFEPTSLDNFIASDQRPELWLGHDNTKVAGSGIELCAVNIGVAFRFDLTNKQYAATIRQMVESNTQDSISIGFTELKARDEVVHGHKVRFIEEASIREISLVPVGACKQAFARIIDANKEPPLSESVTSDMFGIEYDLHNIRSIRKDNDLAIDWLQQRLSSLENEAYVQPVIRSMTANASNRIQTERYDLLQAARRAKLGM
jgi:HK97 family phage prohead protease